MGKKRRIQVRSPSPPAASSAGTLPRAAPQYHTRLFGSAKYRRRLRLLLVFLVPLLMLGGSELVLRVLGYGVPLNFFVPMPDGQTLTTNRRFGWRFMDRDTATQPYPALMDAKKKPGTRRIFILGESAAVGTPAPAFGFGRILEIMLEEQFPGQRFEVVNAAMRGINSHVILPISRECRRYEPDLFLLYMGNNEAVGLHAPVPGEFNLTPYPSLIHLRQTLKETRLGQLLGDMVRGLKKKAQRPEQDMEYFRAHCLLSDAPERQPVYENFRANLQEIIRTARRAHASVVVSTVAVNLADFPPLESQHRPGLSSNQLTQWGTVYSQGTNAEAHGLTQEAITHYRAALAVDDHFAELHYRLARCCVTAGDSSGAAQHFALARDWDALSFRTDSRLNQITRDVATQHADATVVLVDAEKAFAAAAPKNCGVPGKQYFNDHVHLSFAGDYLLARTALPAVIKALGIARTGGDKGTKSRAVPSLEECAQHLAFTEWDDISVASAMVRSQAKAPFLDQLEHAQTQAQANAALRQRIDMFQKQNGPAKAISIYQAALDRRPNDWQILMNYGTLLSDFRDHAAAAQAFAKATERMPTFMSLRLLLVKSLWTSGQRRAAQRELQAALKIDPHYPPAQEAMRMMGVSR